MSNGLENKKIKAEWRWFIVGGKVVVLDFIITISNWFLTTFTIIQFLNNPKGKNDAAN